MECNVAKTETGLWYVLPVLVFVNDADMGEWSLSLGWLKWGVTLTLNTFRH